MKITPRYYQTEALEAMKKSVARRPLVVLPTGSGKTYIIKKLPGEIILCPFKELVKQNGKRAMTIHEAYAKGLRPKVAIVDEAHRIAPDQFGMFGEVLSEADKIYGLSATPYRLDHGELVPEIFDETVYEKSREELTEEGYLAPLVHHDIPLCLLTNVDIAPNNIELVKYIKEIKGSKLIFCRNIAHARMISTLGNWSMVCTGVNGRTRASLLRKLKAGEIDTLVNVQMLNTGFDYPELDNVIILAPTTSKAQYEQTIGRATRLAPGKTEGHIYDFTISQHSSGKPVNYATLCILCGSETDRRLRRCENCKEELIREIKEQRKKKCSCGVENRPAATHCASCGEDISRIGLHTKEHPYELSTLGTNHKKLTIGEFNMTITNVRAHQFRIWASGGQVKVVYHQESEKTRFIALINSSNNILKLV